MNRLFIILTAAMIVFCGCSQIGNVTEEDSALSANIISISIGEKKNFENGTGYNVICQTTNKDTYYLSFCSAAEWDNLDVSSRELLVKEHVKNDRTMKEDYMIFHHGNLETLYLNCLLFVPGDEYLFFAAGYDPETNRLTTDIFTTRHIFPTE